MRRRAGFGAESTFFLKLCSNISSCDSRSCVIRPIFFELFLELKRLCGRVCSVGLAEKKSTSAVQTKRRLIGKVNVLFGRGVMPAQRNFALVGRTDEAGPVE